MRTAIVIHSNCARREYFFSTDHCQRAHSKEPYPDGFVPVSFYLPHRVAPRPSLPDGVVRTRQDVVTVYHSEGREIPNPDPIFQPG